MSAPLFTTRDVNRLIALPKQVLYEDWQSTWSSRPGGSTSPVFIKVYPADPAEELELLICRDERRDRGEVFLTFSAKQKHHGKPYPVCSYHLQQGQHRNPKWFSPRLIKPREFHKHLYSERAVREGLPSDWSLCATPIALPASGTFQQQMDRLTGQFIKDLNIDFFDDKAEQLFKGR